MKIERVSVFDIKVAAYNPRKELTPTDPEYQAIQRSLDRWDLVEPLVWNKRSGNLVGGHQRFRVLLDRGDAEVDVSVVDLPLEDEKALNLALNKITGEWDNRALADVLRDLDQQSFDLSVTGFTTPEIAEVLRTLDEQSRFVPTYTPSVSSHEYSGEDVNKARERLDGKFDRMQSARAQVMTDVKCPACGEEFSIA